jgi:hypothetical protein
VAVIASYGMQRDGILRRSVGICAPQLSMLEIYGRPIFIADRNVLECCQQDL